MNLRSMAGCRLRVASASFAAVVSLGIAATAQESFGADPPRVSPPPGVPMSLHQRLDEFDHLSRQKFQAGDTDGAVRLLQEAFDLAKAGFGATSPETTRVCQGMAEIHRAAGRYQEALAWISRAVANFENRNDTRGAPYARTLEIEGEIFLAINQNLKALQCFEKAHPILLATLPETDNAVHTSWHNMGVGFYVLGRYVEAEKYLNRALELRKKVLGSDNIPVAMTEDHLGRIFQTRGDLEQAATYLTDALHILLDHKQEVPTMAGRSLLNLVSLNAKRGNHAAAETCLAKAESVFREFLPAGDPEWAYLYKEKGRYYFSLCRFQETETAWLDALETFEKVDPRSAMVADLCLGLAEFYQATGLFVKAGEYYDRGRELVAESSGAVSIRAAKAGFTEAGFYLDCMWDPPRADALIENAARVMETLTGAREPEFEFLRARVAHLRGDDAASERILRDVVADFERTNQTGDPRYNMAQIKLAEHAGGDFPATCRAVIDFNLRKLRTLHDENKNTTQSTAALVHPLLIIAETNLMAGDASAAQEFATHALDPLRKNFPIGHDFHRRTLEALAYALFDQKLEVPQALLEEWMKSQLARVGVLLATPLENDRMQWAAREWPFDLPCSLGLPRETALLALRSKNILFEIDQEYHRFACAARTPEGKPLWERLLAQRAGLLEAGRDNAPQAVMEKLSADEAATERELFKLSRSGSDVRLDLGLTLESLQSALPEDAALLDYVTYSHRARGGDHEMRYGIIVQRKGHEPRLCDTKHDRREVDALANLFRKSMGSPGRNPAEKNQALGEVLQTMGDIILGPALAELGDLTGIKTLIISPDGELQALPFAVLLDHDGRFYGERFRIQYVSSARDLLRPQKEFAQGQNAVIAIFGNSTFGLESSVAATDTTFAAGRAAELLRDLSGVVFSPLPGTQRELNLLRQAAEDAAWTADIYDGSRASEKTLRSLVPAPRVLHLATRGFYFPNPANAASRQVSALRKGNPKQPAHWGGLNIFLEPDRSGVLLAGAECTLKNWRQMKLPPSDDDGFFSGSEVLEINLRGTQLVTLSACDTGVGEATPNYGITS
ncbi:MAG TPA: CHAT domain-containing tetratricopeptide repeat protein, partial [Verrucomicrobiaceae bacterium]